MPRLTFKLLLTLVLVLTTANVMAAPSRSRHERRSSLVWLLSSYHMRLDKRTLDEIGSDTVELLIDIANTRADAPKVRVRALAGLGYYPTQDSYAFLTSLLNERNLIGSAEGLQMRRQAIRSLGRAFGDRAVDDLLSLRHDDQAGIRQSVAQALGDTGSERALPDLELWLSTEQDLTVRIAVDTAVNQLRGR
jgi:HEAT repeat protein